MAGEMGNISGHATGRVIKQGTREWWVENVLASVPEQLWIFDDQQILGGDVDVPMHLRRQIIEAVLDAAGVFPDV